jgi:hypothetical protein
MQNMNRYIFLILLLICPLLSFSVEIKIVATVNDNIISNQDLIDHQKVVSFLNDGLKISSAEALDDLTRQYLFVDQAKKLGIMVPEKNLENAIEFFTKQGLPDEVNLESLENYIRNELIYRKVVEDLILPTIQITDEQIESQKNLIRENQDSFNLAQISKSGEVINLGWLGIDDLNKNIKNAVLKTKVGNETKFIDDNKIKVLDKENNIILSSNFEVETQDKKTLNIQLKDLDKKSRDNLLKTLNDEYTTISYQNKKVKVKILNNDLQQLLKVELYKNEAIKREDDLKKELIKNAVIINK